MNSSLAGAPNGGGSNNVSDREEHVTLAKAGWTSEKKVSTGVAFLLVRLGKSFGIDVPQGTDCAVMRSTTRVASL